jgi:hypothetical protein
MTMEVKVNIGIDGISVETEDGFGAWSEDLLNFDYGDWRVYVEANEIDYIGYRLILQFADDGKILLSCDNYFCNDNEEYNNREIEEIEDDEDFEEDADGCCEYKNFEITDNYTIQNDYFFIRFVKNQKSAK